MTVNVISLNNLGAVNPGAGIWDGGHGSSGQQSVFAAWNSGIYAPYFSARGAMIYPALGGDRDWLGNEAYVFPFAATTSASRTHAALTYSRLTDPSTALDGTDRSTDPAFDNVKGLYGDGTPGVPHSYDSLAHLPPQAGGGPKGSIVFPTRCVVYTIGRFAWAVRLNLHTGVWSVASTAASTITLHDANSWVYYPPHRRMYGFPSGSSIVNDSNYYYLDFSAGTGTGVFGSVFCGNHNRLGYVVSRYWVAQRRILQCGDTGGGLGFYIYNMETPGLPIIPTLSGDALPLSAGSGWDMVPETGMIYLRSSLIGDEQFIWTIKPPQYNPVNGTPWVVTKRTLAGVTVADATPNGAFKRGCSWIDKARILTWVNSNGGHTYGFRPLGA